MSDERPEPSAALHQQETVAGPAPAPVAAAGVPTELAEHPRYRVVRPLGSGGMGTVYLAEHRVMERLVALKVIRANLVREEAAVERFRREVKAAAALSHPNVVTAYDAEQVGALHFLVMEYVEGIDLARHSAAKGPLPVTQACAYIRQAALGLQHAHEKGMIHRDIKPHNLMLTAGAAGEPHGRVKILDFGLARFLGAGPGGQTASHMILGTVDFMAPEQAEDARGVDIRADIYSLGCTFYYLLAARVPFPEGTLLQKVAAHMRRQPAPLSKFRGDVPPPLLAILGRMMAKRPEERYRTPDDLCAALDPLLDPGRTAAWPAPPPVAIPVPVAVPSTAPRRPAPPTVLEPADTEPAPSGRPKPSRPPARAGRSGWALLAGCLLTVLLSAFGCVGGVYFVGSSLRSALSGLPIVDLFLDESSAWDKLEANWSPPPPDVGDDHLFPRRLGKYSRHHVNNGTVPGLKIDLPARHAHYKDFWDMDVYAYRVSAEEKESLYTRLIDQFNRADHFGEGIREQEARLSNSPKSSKLSYYFNGFGSERGKGILWWKDGWLFVVRTEPIEDPEPILRQYLRAIQGK